MMLGLKKKLQEVGISQSELSRRTGMHYTTVTAIVNGRLIPWDGQKQKIADALGIECIDELLREVD
ncbi:MAG: helix-turn-helix transcriptional regulator [Coriobacteriia bacterium]|nr:helix-turn-helix transcriptional regulator [Coriobacteriia bacterium]MCL2870791.1 helix-turn-helix transcriptional regulator [Coriobacteriia bacterium]